MSAPTLINLPPPPSDPVTPSEAGPGTPNSTTTSMSELSTVAIKDGHRGHPHHHHTYDKAAPMSNLDTERADRISRLPGLERVTALRHSSNTSTSASAPGLQSQGYFDSHAGVPQIKERSTVGSASATGSVGGRTTWASGSDRADTTDKMSEDMETSSVGALSDEGNASLVGFGEGASSTVSGPVSSMLPNSQANLQRHSMNARISAAREPRNLDGMTYDAGAVDAAGSTPPAGRRRYPEGTELEDVRMGESHNRMDD